MGGKLVSYRGRSKLVTLFSDRAVLLEFKLAEDANAVERLRTEGIGR